MILANSFTAILRDASRHSQYSHWSARGRAVDSPEQADSCNLPGAILILAANRPELDEALLERVLRRSAYAVAARRGRYLTQLVERGLHEVSRCCFAPDIIEICREADEALGLPIYHPQGQWEKEWTAAR